MAEPSKFFRVAIIGRPNVGKSTLFNRITGQNLAITSKISGTTRDRIIAPVFLGSKFCELVDTGGILPSAKNIDYLVTEDAKQTAKDSDLILFVVDAKAGLTNLDLEISVIFRKINKPIILVVNKSDQKDFITDLDWQRLGIKSVIDVSAISGRNIDALEKAIAKNIKDHQRTPGPKEAIKIAIIGKPNVGKSSLINTIFGSPRLLVDCLAGTTRDSVDVYVEIAGFEYVFIDTAGIRKKQKIADELEEISTQRARSAIARADICIYLTDLEKGLVSQDINLLNLITEKGKGLILGVSKWDLKKDIDRNQLMKSLYYKLNAYNWVPIVFTSSKTKQGIEELIKTITLIKNNFSSLPTDNQISRVIRKEYQSFPGLQAKIYFTRLKKQKPFALEVFVSNPKLLPNSFERFLSRIFRKNFPLTGVPIKIIFRKSQ